MFYSVTLVMGEVVTMDDPYGEITVTTKDFFDYDVKENDVLTFNNGVFSIDKAETEHRKKLNYERVQRLAFKG